MRKSVVMLRGGQLPRPVGSGIALAGVDPKIILKNRMMQWAAEGRRGLPGAAVGRRGLPWAAEGRRGPPWDSPPRAAVGKKIG